VTLIDVTGSIPDSATPTSTTAAPPVAGRVRERCASPMARHDGASWPQNASSAKNRPRQRACSSAQSANDRS
jgi:hypothetical protein